MHAVDRAGTSAAPDAAGQALRRNRWRSSGQSIQNDVLLRASQIEHFRIFGFVVLRQLFEPSEVVQLRDEVDAALTDAYGMAYGRNTRDDMPAEAAEEVAAAGNFLPLMSVRTPLSLALVADDDRLWTSAEQLLGDITVASPALATCLVADTPWHHDPGIGDPWLRFNAYLQPAAASTGALRVVAGSHVPETGGRVGSYLASLGVEWRDRPNALPGLALETEPGDVIGFDPRLYHSAWGRGRRLRWSVDYAEFPAATDSVRRAKIRDLVQELSDWPHPPQWPVWDEWLQEDAPASRARAIDSLTELGAL